MRRGGGVGIMEVRLRVGVGVVEWASGRFLFVCLLVFLLFFGFDD